jgi:uncharacterized membrane protein
MKDFLTRFWEVVKYVPSGTWKLWFAIHVTLLAVIAPVFMQNGYSTGKAFFLSFFWFAIIIYPIVLYFYWRMHHGEGDGD